MIQKFTWIEIIVVVIIIALLIFAVPSAIVKINVKMNEAYLKQPITSVEGRKSTLQNHFDIVQRGHVQYGVFLEPPDILILESLERIEAKLDAENRDK